MNLLRYIQWHVTGYPRLNCYILSLLYVNSTYKNGQPSTVYFNDPAKEEKKLYERWIQQKKKNYTENQFMLHAEDITIYTIKNRFLISFKFEIEMVMMRILFYAQDCYFTKLK